MDNKDFMNAIYVKHGLTPDDVTEKRTKDGKLMYRIISRRGFDKIEARFKGEISFEVLRAEKDFVYLMFTGSIKDENGNIRRVVTTGEASTLNVKNPDPYLMAMAEKRGRARCILKLEGLYQEGFHDEDEADTFEVDEKPRRAKL